MMHADHDVVTWAEANFQDSCYIHGSSNPFLTFFCQWLQVACPQCL